MYGQRKQRVNIFSYKNISIHFNLCDKINSKLFIEILKVYTFKLFEIHEYLTDLLRNFARS